MGNCLPFLHLQRQNGDDDLTRLENIQGGNSSRSSTSQSRRSSRASAESGGSSSRRGAAHRHRNMHPSSYVNELYVNQVLAGGAPNDEHSVEEKALNERRKARVRGLLEQIPVDVYTEGGKGDDECAICMIDFVVMEPIRFLPCMHSYHVKCIDDWLLRSFTCPSCMEPVDSAILSSFTANSTTGTNLAALECSPANIGSFPSKK